jgi:nitrogen regulatory protein P-II 1
VDDAKRGKTMKEVKPLVRIGRARRVVRALEESGFTNMTIVDVSALGRLADQDAAEYSIEFIDKYSKMAKIELVCPTSDVERAVNVIREGGCTHAHGDGNIFVSPVERAVKIRSGEEERAILQS